MSPMAKRVLKLVGEVLGVVAGVRCVALVLGMAGGNAVAAEKNKCGCYRDSGGTCYCDKKAKCGCEGDCEPKHCVAARRSRSKKSFHAETKRAADCYFRLEASSDTEKAETDKDNERERRPTPKG